MKPRDIRGEVRTNLNTKNAIKCPIDKRAVELGLSVALINQLYNEIYAHNWNSPGDGSGLSRWIFKTDTYSLEKSEGDDDPAISLSEAKENDGRSG